MPKKGKDGYYHSKVVPAPGAKPIYYRAKTLAEFKRLREQIIEDYKTGRSRDNPVFWDIVQEWYKVVKEPRIRSAGTRMYYTHAISILGKVLDHSICCRAVRYSTLQAVYDTFAGKNLTLVHSVRAVLRAACRYAVINRYMDYDPSTALVDPVIKEPQKRSAPKASEIRTILEAAAGDPYGVVIQIAYYTGARIGEVLGLKWQDVDWGKKQIHICRAVVQHEAIMDGHNVGPLKTQASDRLVPMPPQLGSILSPLRGLPDTYICPGTSRGSMLTHTSAYRCFRRIFDAAGARITPHQLRHNYATACYLAGIPLSVAMQWLGHSDYKMTVQVYAEIKKAISGDDDLDLHLRDALLAIKGEMQLQDTAW